MNDEILLCPGSITYSYNKELEVEEERLNQECFSCRRLAIPAYPNRQAILAWHGHGPCPDKLEL